MSWREDQLRGGWVDDDQPRAFVGSVSRAQLRVVLPDGRETVVPYDSHAGTMTVVSSLPQKWSDGAPLDADDLGRIERQVTDAVAASGYQVRISRG